MFKNHQNVRKADTSQALKVDSQGINHNSGLKKCLLGTVRLKLLQAPHPVEKLYSVEMKPTCCDAVKQRENLDWAALVGRNGRINSVRFL